MTLISKYPPAHRGKIIVWGLLSTFSFGGMVWQVLHYLIGLRRLGFDVWYVEDSDRMVTDPDTWLEITDYSNYIQFLSNIMERAGFKDRWVFRAPGKSQKCFGCVDFVGLKKLYKEVDAAFNICGAQEFLPYHEDIRCRVYIETDPVRPQLAIAKGHQGVIEDYKHCHHIFTYGENIGHEDCLVPIEMFHWKTTRPPVIMDWWNSTHAAPKSRKFTTIANWDTKDKGIQWNGEIYYWQKDYTRFIDLPSKSKIPLELALSEIPKQSLRRIKENGWLHRPAWELSDFDQYHDYICDSLGEFTVSKDQVVRLRSGWFSDRSVCYLAAGRPVITEETGFSKFIPTGEGLFNFSKEDEILEAIQAINSNYEKQSQRARDIAEEYFKAETVIEKILDSVGL